MSIEKSIELNLAGSGFIFYSPFAASGILDGEDYLASGFENPSEVEKQALEGRIVGVSTGSSGTFLLDVHDGYPLSEMQSEYKYKLRLGVEVRGRVLCIRDIFDLIDWSVECPVQQKIELENGFYHITLLSNDPASGILGDNQEVLVYLQKLSEMPQLRFNGVPTLC
jgi:hypothetical protein